MFGLFQKRRWALWDCLTGAWCPLDRFPFALGNDAASDWRLQGDRIAPKHGSLSLVNGHCLRLKALDETARIAVNGEDTRIEDLMAGTDYALQMGSHLLLARGDKNIDRWRAGLDHEHWTVFDPNSQSYEGPWGLSELLRLAPSRGWMDDTIAVPQGATMGFYLGQIRLALGVKSGGAEPPPEWIETSGGSEVRPAPVASRVLLDGPLTCPVCWCRFALGDLMHVATHDALRGDPVLGEDAPLRFHATQFNDRGQALDAFGLPSVDLACPHCRRILPPGFARTDHLILSIVGDQSAGKSYYLSVLAKRLPVTLYRNFATEFYDADPAGNAPLNDMKRTLFSARSPEEARLAKTQLEGIMYERLPRFGRTVMLPRPFIFYLHRVKQAETRCAVVFYDNAGEHFQPGRDSDDSPGAQHVASSAGILFLFDPFNHPEFRRRLADQKDPQLERPLLDQQDVILAELKARVKRRLNLGVGDRMSRPLAVLVGKCDAWRHWLGEEALPDPVSSGYLDLAAVTANSERVRELMLELAPTVVANAEGVSQQVVYFPVSAFGHPPVRVGEGEFVPHPGRIEPFMVEAPVLWILSQVRPDLVPAR